jgi:tetratricopeptide (TPR) repeat protein
MLPIDTIEHEVNLQLSQEAPSPTELRKLSLEIEETLASPEYDTLDSESRARLQSLRKDLKAALQKLDQQAPTPNPAQTPTDEMPYNSAHAPQQHTPEAESYMEEAERLFYGGRYVEALKLFDKVLQIESGWERARQHRSESENYLRSGYIPTVALPADAASAFGKAQSAARLGRNGDALALLQKAQNVLRELGIQRWQEGQEFEQKLQESLDAENVYEEGIQLFEQGRLDEGIDRVDTAARATGLPRYGDKANAMRRVRDSLQTISAALSAPTMEPRTFLQAKAELDALAHDYSANPALQRLKTRLEAQIPRVANPMKEQARALKNQAEKSRTIEGAAALATQAKSLFEQARSLEGSDEANDRPISEVDKLLRDIQKYDDDLQTATSDLEQHSNWPAAAARRSIDVRKRYPADPQVITLNRGLSRYYQATTGLKAIGFLAIIILLIFTVMWVSGRVHSFIISLTPTPTATLTLTPSTTPTASSTPTPTLTVTPTPSVTPTPTAVSGQALRPVWVRSGCYESFPAINRVPQGGILRFIPSDRRFDPFQRECVLVEYRFQDQSIIGWVLISDVTGR